MEFTFDEGMKNYLDGFDRFIESLHERSEDNAEHNVLLHDLTFEMLMVTMDSDEVTMPSADCMGRSVIKNKSHFNNWYNTIADTYGNVEIVLRPYEKTWFLKTEIVSDNYKEAENNFSSHMKEYVDNERKLGRSID